MSDGSGYRIHTFTNSDTFTVTSGGNVDVLLVAGGGGGGGGAGGLIYSNAFFDHSGVYPTFASQWLGSTIPTNYQVRCYVPRGDTSWASFAATSVTPLTTTETNSFRANYPAETLPVGTWVTTGGRKQWYSTWVAAAA